MKTSSFPLKNLANLKKRAHILSVIRAFFADREVLEVETPLLGCTTVTDPHILSFCVPCPSMSLGINQHKYLQTSPEFFMKRLLVAGCGSIYQISKAFRLEEEGRWHLPEFTLLEWYRVGFDHHALICEVDQLLQKVLNVSAAERISYADLFEQYLGINPHLSSIEALQACARKNSLFNVSDQHENKDYWLQLLMSHCIDPHLGKNRPIFVTDFPASQAGLSKICHDYPPVAQRFEAYYQGVELLNGYHELTDVVEQKRRFIWDNQQRISMGLPEIQLDEAFLQALQQGLPDCAGVALGVDRLVMLAVGAISLDEVVSFT